jgi:hypothetical protein
MRVVGHVMRTREMGNSRQTLVGDSQKKKALGIPRQMCEGNILQKKKKDRAACSL